MEVDEVAFEVGVVVVVVVVDDDDDDDDVKIVALQRSPAHRQLAVGPRAGDFQKTGHES